MAGRLAILTAFAHGRFIAAWIIARHEIHASHVVDPQISLVDVSGGIDRTCKTVAGVRTPPLALESMTISASYSPQLEAFGGPLLCPANSFDIEVGSQGKPVSDARVDMDLVVVPTSSDKVVVVGVPVWCFRTSETCQGDLESASSGRREMRILFCKRVSGR